MKHIISFILVFGLCCLIDICLQQPIAVIVNIVCASISAGLSIILDKVL
jgi:hypothetical protein